MNQNALLSGFIPRPAAAPEDGRRDLFAAAALQGLLVAAGRAGGPDNPGILASRAFDLADAMLRASMDDA